MASYMTSCLCMRTYTPHAWSNEFLLVNIVQADMQASLRGGFNLFLLL